MSPAAKVGVATLIAALILGVAILHFSSLKYSQIKGSIYYVVFDNVGGLQEGSIVHLAGAQVGKVVNLQLLPNNKVRIEFVISTPGVQLRKGAVFTISTSFMGDKTLEIMPRIGQLGALIPPGSEVQGRTPLTLDDLLLSGDQTMRDLQAAAAVINDILGDPQLRKDLKDSAHNFSIITSEMKGLSLDLRGKLARLSGSLENLVANANSVVSEVHGEVSSIGSDIKGTTGTLKRIANTNEKDVKLIVENLRQTSQDLKDSMKSIKALVTKEGFNDNILATLENIKEASENVAGIAADVRLVTGDPQVRENIKATVQTARETAEGAKAIVDKVKGWVGAGQPGGAKLFGLDANVEWKSDTGQASPNINLELFPQSANGGKIGLDDLGYGNLFNLQYRRKLGTSAGARVGVVRSQLGMGLDWDMGRRLGVSCDAYDLRKTKVDFTGRVYVGKDFYLLGGVRDAFDARNEIFGVGKRF